MYLCYIPDKSFNLQHLICFTGIIHQNMNNKEEKKTQGKVNMHQIEV